MQAKVFDNNPNFVVFIAIVAAFGGLLFGFDTGIISGAILFIKVQFHLTPAMNGIVVSAVLFGAFLGAITSGRFADHFGRRKTLLTCALIFIFSTLGSAFSPTVFWLIFSRVFVGIAIGIASFTTPTYISEVAPAKYRGALVTLNQLLVTVGIVASYLVDFSFAAKHEWRFMLGSGVIPALLLFVGMLFVPRSPRWLIMKGYEAVAEKILKQIRGSDDVEYEVNQIRDSIIDKKGSWKLIFQPWVRPVIIVGFGLAILQQFAGINTIIYYAPTILKTAGFHSNVTAILATLGVGVVNVIFTIIAIPFIDKLGRRPLLLIGVAGMAISLALMGLSFDAAQHSELLKWFTLGGMLLYIPCFAISLGPILWLMIAEIFPLEIRGLAASLSSSVNWGSNMLVALTFLTMINLIGSADTFLFYSAICIAGFFFVYFLVPETKGVSLEQIEKNLRAGISSRWLGS